MEFHRVLGVGCRVKGWFCNLGLGFLPCKRAPRFLGKEITGLFRQMTENCMCSGSFFGGVGGAFSNSGHFEAAERTHQG